MRLPLVTPSWPLRFAKNPVLHLKRCDEGIIRCLLNRRRGGEHTQRQINLGSRGK